MLRLATLALAACFPLTVYAEALVAIDVLIEPDHTMIAAAEDWNGRLREQTPDGFELDATHAPHVTLLQTYVAEADLDAVLAAVAALAADYDLAGLTMTATGLYHIPSGEIGLQGIVVEPSEDLLALQDRVIEALAPYRMSGGGEAAFVPDPTGTPFDPLLFTYVDTFVRDQSGGNFNPHVSTGVGPLAWLEAREAEPFAAFTFGADGLAVYRLGNFGTAAEKLSED